MKQSMIFSTVLCILIVLQLTTTTTAQWKSCFNDSCPMKSLKFSSKLSSKCNKGLSDCILTSGATLNDNSIVFNLKVAEAGDVDRSSEIDWEEGTANVLYTCGPIATTKVNNYIYPKINGTAIYTNGKAYCSWSMDMDNSSFPFELIDPPQYYISQSGYQIYYNLNQTVPVAAANYSQLPKSVEPFVDGYKYKAVGSEKYLLIAREANVSTDFLLRVNGETPRLVEVNLKNDISIDIGCNFEKLIVITYAKYDQSSFNILQQVHGVTIGGNECRWSLPDSLDSSYGIVKPKQTTYELQMIENNRFVYFDEENFRIETPTSGFSSSILTKSLLIFVLFSVIFIVP